MGRDERMGHLTRQRYTDGPYRQPGMNNDGLRRHHQLREQGLVVEGVWPDVHSVVLWKADGSREELLVQPTVVPGKRRAKTVFVPV